MIVDISYSIFNQWDAIIVINVLGTFQNGIYKSVAFIGSLPYALSVILQTKLLPEYSSYFHQGDLNSVKKSFNKYNRLLLIILLFVVTSSLILGKLILNLLYNEEISTEGYIYLPAILLSVMLYVLSVPSVSVLLAKNKENIVRNMSLVQAIGFVLVSTFFIEEFGLVILPLSLIFLNLIFLFVNYFFATRNLGK
jgi:O-antigen/teichoic acid export membrane protein